MKIQLDFGQKRIKIEEDVKLGSFIAKLKTLNIGWENWTIETNTVINNWTYPITHPQPYWTNHYWWESQPFYNNTAGSYIDGNASLTLNADTPEGTATQNVYNVDF